MKATFPGLGIYTDVFTHLVRRLGFDPVPPPRTTPDTVNLGVRHSSDMICFPFKIILGNLIQGLEKGAEAIISPSVNPNMHVKETCRTNLFYHIQEQILRRLGYEFKMIYVLGGGLRTFTDFLRANPAIGVIELIRILAETYQKVKEIEEREFKFVPRDINVGLVGDVYTLWEPYVNHDIIAKLTALGIGVHVSLTLSWYLKHAVGLADTKKHLHEEAREYFRKPIGGHGWESVYNTLYYARNGFDGVIHLLPLTCMPETIAEMPMDMVSNDYSIPVYRFSFDENRFEAGVDTRIETFVKILQRNKKRKHEALLGN